MKTISPRVALSPLPLLLLLSALAWGCGDRPKAWSEEIRLGSSHGMADAVAVVDDAASRVVIATPGAGAALVRSHVPVGHNVVLSELSRDRSTIFLLSVGDLPRRRDEDQRPSLTVVKRKEGATTARTFPLASAFSGMTLDPLGRYVALHAAPESAATTSRKTAFVENPNEVVVIDLERAESAGIEGAVVSRTLRSFGGRPERLTFTPPLSLPGGSRRLLVVETEQDVALLDLDHLRDSPERPEITVRLGSGSTSKVLEPAGIVIDDGEPSRNDDTRIAIRTKSDSSVVTLTLGPVSPPPAGVVAPPNPNDFAPTVNLVDFGGAASDLAFVRTDGGLRLAAIVPGTASAVLVEPETGLTDRVALPAGYQHVSLVTREVTAATPDVSDVALLWGATSQTAGVAFWALGKTSGQPYRSVEVVSVGGAVAQVVDVPAPNAQLKLLSLGGNAGSSNFVVLDLRARTAAPLVSSGVSLALEASFDGQRVWAYQKGTTNLASVTLVGARPVSLDTERTIDAVYDISNTAGGRSLVAVHQRGAVGLTVLDALAPDPARAVSYSGLLLEGLK